MDYGLVESSEVLVFEVFPVYEVPLATGIFVGPAVALTGEVDPFGVPEFVTHEIEVSAVDGREGYQSNHLVERHTAVYCHVGIAFAHVPVHYVVDQTENDSLVAHQCLVVTFGVVDGFFVGATVGEFPKYGGRVSILLFLLFYGLYSKNGKTPGHLGGETETPTL